MASASRVDHFAGGAEHAHFAPVVEGPETHALALAGGGGEPHHGRDVDGRLALDDPAGLVGLRVRLGVALDQVDVLDGDAVFAHLEHVALLAFVFAGDHDDLITFTNTIHDYSTSYRTSGASDTIFMKRSVRSSRVTGPKMRVPIGSSLLLSSTAALPSKRISEPSERRTPLAVRTTTAL